MYFIRFRSLAPHDLLEDQERYMEEVKTIVIVKAIPAPQEISKEQGKKENTHDALHGMPGSYVGVNGHTTMASSSTAPRSISADTNCD
jgi:hypothetical protein